MTSGFELRAATDLWSRIDEELKAGPRDGDELERAGFLLCGLAWLDGRVVLLGRHWMPVPSDARERNHALGLAWSARFNANVLDEADEGHAVPVLVHRHATGRPADLSLRDRQYGDPMMRSMSELAEAGVAASVVVDQSTAAGILWERGSISGSLTRIRVVGVPLVDIEPTLPSLSRPRRRLARQTVAMGPASDARLARARVAIAGLSGGGSHVGQQLAHAGVGSIAGLDDDAIDETNRGRVVGSRHDDEGEPKTEVMARLIRSIDPQIAVVKVPHRSSHPEGLAALAGADVIVACVDRLDARAEINAIARRYLVPLIDVGMTIESEGEQLASATGQVVLTLPGGPCLRCTPLLSDAALARERRMAPRGYDRNPDAPGDPQVVSMNGLLASQAVTITLGVLSGYPRRSALAGGGWWQYDALDGQLDHSELVYRRPGCPGCAEEGHGDPWFLRAGRRGS